MSYQDQRQWSDQFIPAIKNIVGPLLLEPASFELDAKQATDLIVLKAKDMRIAARVRQHKYMEKYANEFTIRRKVNGSAKTEAHKILEGWGDWMFYGFISEDEFEIERWYVIDLDCFRWNMITRREKIMHKRKKNKDGTELTSFDIRSFSPEIIVSSSHSVDFFEA